MKIYAPSLGICSFRSFSTPSLAANRTDSKLVRRHPHVFAKAQTLSSEEQTQAWEAQKATERAERARRNDSPVRILDDIPATMPAMLRALKLQKRAGRVGFDWPNVAGSLSKVDEELNELRMSISENEAQSSASSTTAATEEELGDLLFSVVNTARKLDVDPERALRGANEKFIRRFQYIEDQLEANGQTIEQSSIDQLEALWVEAKAESEDSGR